jgi:hypothetical protein
MFDGEEAMQHSKRKRRHSKEVQSSNNLRRLWRKISQRFVLAESQRRSAGSSISSMTMMNGLFSFARE